MQVMSSKPLVIIMMQAGVELVLSEDLDRTEEMDRWDGVDAAHCIL
jgi:hypothetical protein